jgi:hypothetical protein
LDRRQRRVPSRTWQHSTHASLYKKYTASALLDECLEHREVFLEKVMGDEKSERDDAKTLVIAVIYGGSYKSPTLSN